MNHEQIVLGQLDCHHLERHPIWVVSQIDQPVVCLASWRWDPETESAVLDDIPAPMPPDPVLAGRPWPT